MSVYAGIDEAGYGPLLGPLVVAMSAFRGVAVADEEGEGLYRALRGAVSRTPGGDSIAVTDSKRLYRPPPGLERLEEPVLAFLQAGGEPAPRRLPDLLARLGAVPPGSLEAYPWYAGDLQPAGVPPPPDLPCAVDPARLARTTGRLRQALRAAGIQEVALEARVLPAGELNRAVARTDSKARVSFELVEGLARGLFEPLGEAPAELVVDRQGGRSHYLPLLCRAFPVNWVQRQREGRRESAYRITDGRRRMRARFVTEADARHLPVALASIVAKYLRELLMERLNAWFGAHDPALRPTAGYVQDARRWLQDTRQLRRRLGVDEALLVRCR